MPDGRHAAAAVPSHAESSLCAPAPFARALPASSRLPPSPLLHLLPLLVGTCYHCWLAYSLPWLVLGYTVHTWRDTMRLPLVYFGSNRRLALCLAPNEPPPVPSCVFCVLLQPLPAPAGREGCMALRRARSFQRIGVTKTGNARPTCPSPPHQPTACMTPAVERSPHSLQQHARPVERAAAAASRSPAAMLCPPGWLVRHGFRLRLIMFSHIGEELPSCLGCC